MEFLYIALFIEASGNPGLVRNNERQIAGIVNCLHCLARAFCPDQIGRSENVSGVPIEYPVAVKKNG